jgi:hypothetical protein
MITMPLTLNKHLITIFERGLSLRKVDYIQEVTKQVAVNLKVAEERIAVKTENHLQKAIEVTIHCIGEDGGLVAAEVVSIRSEMYDLLMSESPAFAPGKPANNYRDNDLWYVIDLVRDTKNKGSSF